MKNFIVVMMLVLCVPVMGGQKQTKEAKQLAIEVKYDRFKDQTVISTPHLSQSGHYIGFGFMVMAVHTGQSMKQPTDVFLLVHSRGSFRSIETDMILLIDGERVTLQGESQVSIDSATVSATLPLLKSISEAKSVEGQISSVEFKLTPEHQRVIGKVWAYFSEPH